MTADRPTRPSRVPALAQAAAVAAVLAVVAAVSLTARQPPPPTVAEYAPQAVAQIQQAPPEQANDPGRGVGGGATTTTAGGPGGTGPNGPGGTTTTSRPVIDQPRVRRCGGNPPRQIEDPQSPPCVPYFDLRQGNGGATYRGVEADKVNVFYTPDYLEDETDVRTLKDFFNTRFETYGREIVLNRYGVQGATDADPKLMQADAERAYENGNFASLNYVSRSGAEFSFYDALADRGVVSVAHRVQAQATDAHFRQRSPYQWSSVPTVDSMLRNYGQFVCSSLAGKAPRYAGGTVAGRPVRVFGLIVQQAADGTAPDPAPLRTELRTCNADVAAVAYNKATSGAGRTGQSQIVAMTDKGVTSVICLCDALETRQTLMPAASAQVYQPEWLLGSYLDNDLDNSMSGAPPDQVGHVLGLLFRNKLLPKQDMPFYWALKEQSAAADPQGGAYYAVQARYSSLLVLASGIQLAGPYLTPQTFAAGLLRSQWANPGAGAAPYFQARAGFEGGRRTFIDDAAMFWVDPNRRSTVQPDSTGAVCYVDRGVRFGLGHWPVGDPPFFQPPCL
ncbi:MAG TPA: hypothetical protein VGO92_12220 [Acidimicrobiales bacterium]|jgi:hypothetical protein|nr:hypothetical protein [Acidimicrobiales bacterium]